MVEKKEIKKSKVMPKWVKVVLWVVGLISILFFLFCFKQTYSWRTILANKNFMIKIPQNWNYERGENDFVTSDFSGKLAFQDRSSLAETIRVDINWLLKSSDFGIEEQAKIFEGYYPNSKVSNITINNTLSAIQVQTKYNGIYIIVDHDPLIYVIHKYVFSDVLKLKYLYNSYLANKVVDSIEFFK